MSHKAFTTAKLALTTTKTALYSAPAATESIVNEINFANVDGTNEVTIDLIYFDSDDSQEVYLAKNFPIPKDSSWDWGSPITLKATDELRALAGDNNDVEVYASIVEIS